MSEKAQVGDTIRLTIMSTYEGVVYEGFSGVPCLEGFACNYPGHTVEILSRAIPPLPNEPGTWWLDREDAVWMVDSKGFLCFGGVRHNNAALYAPFRQLVLKEDR